MTFQFLNLNGVRYLKNKVQQMTNAAISRVTPESIGAAPISHRDTGARYGTGTDIAYGHVGLSDSIIDTRNIGNGFAATPLAVKLLGEASAKWGGLLQGKNLNELHRAGFWGVDSNCTNKPGGVVDGCIAVLDYCGSDNLSAQIFVKNTSPTRLFFRGVDDAVHNTWTPWLEVATK